MCKHKIEPRAQLPNEDVTAAEGHSALVLATVQQNFRTDEIKRVTTTWNNFWPSFSPSSWFNDLGQTSIFGSHNITEKKAPPGQAPASLGKQLQSLLPVCHLSFLFKLIRSVIWEREESKMKRQMLGSRSGLTSMQHCKIKEAGFWSNNVLWRSLFKITDWYFSFLTKEKRNKVTFQHRESRETSLRVTRVILDFFPLVCEKKCSFLSWHKGSLDLQTTGPYRPDKGGSFLLPPRTVSTGVFDSFCSSVHHWG